MRRRERFIINTLRVLVLVPSAIAFGYYLWFLGTHGSHTSPDQIAFKNKGRTLWVTPSQLHRFYAAIAVFAAGCILMALIAFLTRMASEKKRNAIKISN